MRKKRKNDARTKEVQEWFTKSVSYNGELYTIDVEQAEAVVCDSLNTIVVARAGSGKTRTIVAKIVYLIAKCGVKPNEIMTFVFNANAASEINARLSKMCVDGVPVMKKSRIATTFHAFARKVVYEACGGKEKCGRILVGEKEDFVLAITTKMLKEEKWRKKTIFFVKGIRTAGEKGESVDENELNDEELMRFAKMMTQFINRAQQKYLGGTVTVGEIAEKYLESEKINTDKVERRGRRKKEKYEKVDAREQVFVELGVECFRRYHWYLLNAKKKLAGFSAYGTDFNLIVSWASKLVAAERGKVRRWLVGKKYILIDEYQDFSQLFLASVEAVRGVAREARLFVVGDDWQAINRFAGSEVEYFKEFEKYFPEDCRRYEITTNYRCDRAIVNTARRFMTKAMKEKGGFRAFSRKAGKVVLVNPLLMECEYAMTEYDKRVSRRDKIYQDMARKMVGRTPKFATVQYMKTIVSVIRKNRRAKEILLLHRNNETNIEGMSLIKLSHGLKWGLAELGIMNEEEYSAKVQIMTMHKSKGLEAEVVIILEADEGVIPKTHPDTRLYGVFGETDEIALDDQKRLFYVAMTRAKKQLYVISEGGGFVKYLGKGIRKWND